MEKLREAGLIGGAMVPISGSLVKRYNECLALLGTKPTKLKSFSIDGMGWSPEVAVEKKNNWYLNAGDANVNAIVIVPAQEDKPVHMPSHSFDRDIMRTVFAAYGKEIKDITKDAAVIVHIDQDIDSFFDPFDLLRYGDITIRFSLLNQLDEKQKEQQVMVRWFNSKNNFLNREGHTKILTLAKEYGDLRNRHLTMDSISVEVGSFYSRAFGGVFVLKDFIKPILVFEDEKWFKKAIKDTAHDVLLFHIHHDELVHSLINHLILEANLKNAIKTPRYERIKKHLFTEHLSDRNHSFKEILNNRVLFKKYLNALPVEARKKITGAEVYFQRSVIDKELKMDDFIDESYQKALLQPHSSLAEEQQQLIWKLLVKIMPKDPLHLYWYDKEAFYNAYGEWDLGYREWIIGCILENNKKYSNDT